MKKQYHRATWMMFIAVLVVLSMILIDKKPNEEQYSKSSNENSQIVDDNFDEQNETEPEQFVAVPYEVPETISKGLAVKMIVLSKEEKESVQVRDREIDYEDTSKEDWYDKYFNIAIIEGWYIPEGNKLNALEPINYQEALMISNYFNVDLISLNIQTEGKENESISYIEWMKLYEAILNQIDKNNQPKEVDLIVFATPTLSADLSSWSMATDHGIYTFEGITMDGCINKEVSFLVKGTEILSIKNIVNENPVLTNAYIKQYDSEQNVAEVFMGGVTRNIPVAKSTKLNGKNNFIADITLKDNEIISIVEKNNTTGGIVKEVTPEEIEIEGLGKLKLTDQTKFYSTVNKLSFVNYNSIVVGYESATIILDNNQVAAAIIYEKVPIKNIRVVINNTGFKSLYHDSVQITAPQSFDVIRGAIVDTYEKDKTIDISEMELELGERVAFVPKDSGVIELKSVLRGYSGGEFNPKYHGKIEVEKTDIGYVIVNEVDLESYLCAVVPSEMPSSYGLEAAKVQAVCARSYAYTQIYENRYCGYGAHVDDSTICQVYNNVPESEQSIKAVEETKGQLLSYNGNVIGTNFFSTSCGVTSDSGDVWPNYITKEFPTVSADYLRFQYQNDSGSTIEDLSNEDDFREFIMNKSLPSFDDEFPWYRWSTVMTAEQIETIVNKNIAERYDSQPKLIKTLDDQNIFRSRPIDDIGDLQDLYVYSRGKSGIITEMIIKGTKGIYKIATEYNIRTLIAPINYLDLGSPVIINRNDGNTSQNLSIMPSAYYVIDKKYDDNGNLETVTFYGGGYGHGVGMSQNGAKAMVEIGYTYDEILEHYYKGTEIITLN